MRDGINQEQAATLEKAAASPFFFGTVLYFNPITFKGLVKPNGVDKMAKMDATFLTTGMSATLGFKETYIPAVGSEVFCFGAGASSCVVIQAVPSIGNLTNLDSLEQRTRVGVGTNLMLSEHTSTNDQQNRWFENNNRPMDSTTGDYVLSNEFGCLLGMYQLFAELRGSELAQIQCFLLDDLVRVISHNFEHFHSMGESRVSQNGNKLNMEGALTHLPVESLGGVQSDVIEPAVLKNTGVSSLDDSTLPVEMPEEAEMTARLRYFVGKLGDFINVLLVKPGKDKEDTGLFQGKLHLDGTFVLRSAKAIVLEKTNWIRVPTRTKREEATDSNQEETVDTDFEFDDSITDNQPFLYYLQLRDYLAYLNEAKGYRQFAVEKENFKLPSNPTGLPDKTYIDPTTEAAYRKKTSRIVLMPNGGVHIGDAWSSAINMEGGNIYIQPAKDLVIQPLRHTVVKTGGHFSLAAKEHVTVSSTNAGFSLKTQENQHFYSLGGVTIENEGGLLNEGKANFGEEDPTIRAVGGIVFKAANSGVFSYGKYGVGIYDESAYLQATQLTLHGKSLLEATSKEKVVVEGADVNCLASKLLNCYAKDRAWFIGQSQTVVARKGQEFGLAYLAGQPVAPVQGLIDDTPTLNFFESINNVVDKIAKRVVEDLVPAPNTKEHFQDLKFLFPSTYRYNFQEYEVIPQTVAQQEFTSIPGLHNMEDWVEKPVNETYPFPGSDAANKYVESTLQNLEFVDGQLFNKTTTEEYSKLTSDRSIFNNYPVQI
jgi:hypothetical protein